MTVNEIYDKHKGYINDIHEHLPTLVEYGKKCNHITEFGVDVGKSTSAFLMAHPKQLISYDIVLTKDAKQLASICTDNFKLIQGSSLSVDIESTDLLFIDSEHSYKQLSQELMLHHSKVKKYIILHDTVTYSKELMPAVDKFLIMNNDWKIEKHYKNNNGLLILAKNS